MEPWFAAPASFLLLVLGVYCHRNWLALFPEDPPGAGRHQHVVPMPMAGWVPTVVAIAAFAYFGESEWIAGGVALASLTGYLDDRGKSIGREMTWPVKGGILTAATALALVGAAEQLQLDPVSLIVAFLWLFAVTNAVNFMDNTNGVSVTLGSMGLLLISQGEGVLAFVGFAFLGFVPANWPRPRVFLGDSGSLGLGLCLGWATLRTVEHPFTWLAVAPIALFALDFTQVILARLVLGIPPWLGDRRHITHISINLGLPRVLVAPLFAAIGYTIFRVAV
jgi:UDP-N-acetylmuramyl pentapeptide phosphotransferase/UDP-N-acetylglucosamine-1-phosphate transferase